MSRTTPRIPLPNDWSDHVKVAIVHVISLAQRIGNVDRRCCQVRNLVVVRERSLCAGLGNLRGEWIEVGREDYSPPPLTDPGLQFSSTRLLGPQVRYVTRRILGVSNGYRFLMSWNRSHDRYPF